ncbi:hypothetical protein [[Mycoplasma] gypis]|uniref:Uncharacterized protein n=1 Tax=[Mycoplasma] gypis TaxID=92404 RepID=A0ABZ2RVC4_9BACT|nr:hypothetical protein [[Mycoplasma] gypis]MBN0919048.1 hypothetical protein [[Mycoplasma] gypis]
MIIIDLPKIPDKPSFVNDNKKDKLQNEKFLKLKKILKGIKNKLYWYNWGTAVVNSMLKIVEKKIQEFQSRPITVVIN